jgi:uncharacterized integral membrane protein (TIGR00698 family)
VTPVAAHPEPTHVRSHHANSRPARAVGQAALSGGLPGLAVVTALAAVAFAVAGWTGLSPLVVGIALGAIVANVTTLPPILLPGIAFAARSLLRVGIVLLGLRLSLGDLAGLGADGLLVVALVVAVTFFGTQLLARRLGIGSDLGLLVATGYSICGASAIAAVNGVVHADEEETAYAITLVTICGTLSIFALPLIANAVGLAGAEFGTWVGASVHDVGQVVATASHGDAAAVEAATVVKLTRVVLLAPLVAMVAIGRRRSQRVLSLSAGANEALIEEHPPLLPAFVVGFLAAIVLRSSGALPDTALEVAAQAEKILLTLALVAMGMAVSVSRMRRLGARPLVLGLLAWLLVAGTAYAGTILV